MSDEMLDLVDATDSELGAVPRGVFLAGGVSGYVRVVNAFLIDPRRRIWVPRRASGKRWFPDCLDFSVGGYVRQGESYDEAFVRETEEELGMRVAASTCRLLGGFSPVRHGVSAFMKVYEIPATEDPDFNRDDFSSATWMEPADLLRRLDSGEAAKGDLASVLRLCYP